MVSPEYISGIDELDSILQKNINKTIMLMFTASWCGPCKKLKSQLYSIDDDKNECGICVEFKDKLLVVYIDVDDENNGELTDIYNVTAMPTQVLLQSDFNEKDNTIKINKIDEIVGCDIISLRMILGNLSEKD